jgi:ATP-dependent protease HslVU (ClpYQ) peptidase subunit
VTCIIGLKHGGKVYIGGDSGAIAGYEYGITTYPKVFLKDSLAIGYTHSFRMAQIIQYLTPTVAHDEAYSDFEYTVQVVEKIRESLKAHGFTKLDNGQEEGGNFLIGYKRELYRVSSEFAVLTYDSPFWSVGSGSEYALGAMAASPKINPERRITQALDIAAQFCVHIKRPYAIRVIE